MSHIEAIRNTIRKNSDKKRALGSARFFKTGSGQYGEGDIFIGLTVPKCRGIAQQFSTLNLTNIKKLLTSKIHEERLIALLLLVNQFQQGSTVEKKNIYTFYLAHTKYINNWDLVDLSADKIVGEYLQNKPQSILSQLAQSKNLWERRIAIVATFAFIKKGHSNMTFTIAKLLINDKHDLIHKAVGWMLREVGKRISIKELKMFLNNYSVIMPRTMLRYAIEHFPKTERKKYLLKKSY